MDEVKRLQCKTCGADLDISLAKNGVLECSYCRNKLIIPQSTNPNVLAFLRMGEHDRDLGQFASATEAYMRAVETDPNEPEAYFGLALSQFGVRFIKDEVNNCLQPICYKVSNKKFVENNDYLNALKKATPEQRAEYERVAAGIDHINDEFYKLQSSKKNEYNCFICVKVTDDDTKQRTADYKDAEDIYFALRGKGFKPFFSERETGNITGNDYEAFILYALVKSKCMIVVCSDEKYLRTKWVKNEYSRYINFIKNNEKKPDSITIVFRGDPIETLPGKDGKIQGINYDSYDRSDKIEAFVRRHTQTQNTELGYEKFDTKKGHKKTNAQRGQTTLTDFDDTVQEENSHNERSFDKQFEVIKSDLKTDSRRAAAIKEIENLKNESTVEGKVDGRIIMAELVLKCNLHSIDDFKDPKNIDKIGNVNVFENVLAFGGTAEWKYYILNILYNYLYKSGNLKNKIKILKIVIDIKYDKRKEMLKTLLDCSKQELSSEIFNMVLPRMELGDKQEINEILGFANEALKRNQFDLVKSAAEKILQEYDDGNITAYEFLLLCKYQAKRVDQILGGAAFGVFDSFDDLKNILEYIPEARREQKLDTWREYILKDYKGMTPPDKDNELFPNNFAEQYDKFLRFYPKEKHGGKFKEIAMLAQSLRQFGVALHYYNFYLNYVKDERKGKIYWQMMMCNVRCREESELYKIAEPIAEDEYFNKALDLAEDNSEFYNHIFDIRANQANAAAVNAEKKKKEDAYLSATMLWREILDECGCSSDSSTYNLTYSVCDGKFERKFNEILNCASVTGDKSLIEKFNKIKREQPRAARRNELTKRHKNIRIAYSVITIFILAASIVFVALGFSNADPFARMWGIWTDKATLGMGTLGLIIPIVINSALLILSIVITAIYSGKVRQILILLLCLVVSLALSGSAIALYVTEGHKEDEKIKEVMAQIDDIGEVTRNSYHDIILAEQAYDNLSPSLQKRVDNYSALTLAKDKYAAVLVEDIIAGLGDASSYSKYKLDEAVEAYNSLTQSQKDYVTNYNTLNAALNKYYDNLVEEINGGIEGLESNVTADNVQQVARLSEKYAELSDGAKAKVKNYDLLKQASIVCDLFVEFSNYQTVYLIDESNTIEAVTEENIAEYLNNKNLRDRVVEVRLDSFKICDTQKLTTGFKNLKTVTYISNGSTVDNIVLTPSSSITYRLVGSYNSRVGTRVTATEGDVLNVEFNDYDCLVGLASAIDFSSVKKTNITLDSCHITAGGVAAVIFNDAKITVKSSSYIYGADGASAANGKSGTIGILANDLYIYDDENSSGNLTVWGGDGGDAVQLSQTYSKVNGMRGGNGGKGGNGISANSVTADMARGSLSVKGGDGGNGSDGGYGADDIQGGYGGCGGNGGNGGAAVYVVSRVSFSGSKTLKGGNGGDGGKGGSGGRSLGEKGSSGNKKLIGGNGGNGGNSGLGGLGCNYWATGAESGSSGHSGLGGNGGGYSGSYGSYGEDGERGS